MRRSIQALAFRLAAAALFGGSVHAQTPAKWTLTPDLRIGGADRGVNYEFTRINEVVLGPNGTVFVSDFPSQLRQYDARGNFVRAIGRTGSGPGEFRRLAAFGFLGDTLWTTDAELKRVSLFTADGRLISTILKAPPGPVNQNALFPGADVSAVFPGGVAVGRATYSSAAAAEGKVRTAPLLRMTRDARTLDTIAWVSTQNLLGLIRLGEVVAMVFQTFGDTPLSVLAPALERVYIVERSVATSPRDATFGIAALRVNSDTIWSRRYSYVPKRVEPAAIDDELSRVIGLNEATLTRDRLRPSLFLPEFRTPVAAAVVAAEGSLWLRREDGRDANVDYLVIGPTGNAIATITVKRTVTIKAVSGDLVWAVETDEDRVETIVRFLILK